MAILSFSFYVSVTVMKVSGLGGPRECSRVPPTAKPRLRMQE